MIICADFDKTVFFRDNVALTAENLAAIKKWRDVDGNVFVLGSNRSLGSLDRALPDWRQYFDYLILDRGARIYDSSRKLLWSDMLSRDVIERVLEAAKENPVPADSIYCNLDSDDYGSEPTAEMTKIYYHFKNQGELDAFRLKIAGVDAKVFCWHNSETDYCIEITPSTAGKAMALRVLLGLICVDEGDAVTVGDGDNDYEMLVEFSGYAIDGSWVAELHPELPTVTSVASLLKKS